MYAGKEIYRLRIRKAFICISKKVVQKIIHKYQLIDIERNLYVELLFGG